MTIAEKLAARLGFYRPTPTITEIIVFESREAARDAGFRGWEHPVHRYIKAYWPGASMGVFASRPFRRVTISSRMLRHVTPEGNLVAILRSRQAAFGDKAMWIVV